MANKVFDCVVFMILVSSILAVINDNVQMSEAATYNVGDNNGWLTPTSPTAYSDWANRYRFVVGDVLVFNFISGQHTVAQVNNRNQYDSCNAGNTPGQTNSPVTIPLNTTGTFYFFCTIHCFSGQKLTVNVGSGNGQPSPPGTPPSPGFNTFSPPPPPLPPPPPSAAATISIFFSGIVVVLPMVFVGFGLL